MLFNDHPSFEIKTVDDVLDRFESHIYKNLNMTRAEEREDLAQEIRLKIIEKFKKTSFKEAPGFFDVLLNDEYY